MKLAIILGLILACAAAEANAQSVTLTGPDVHGVVEGKQYPLSWQADGVQSVGITAHGLRTLVGGQSRGVFDIAVVESMPPDVSEVSWTVPWIDAITFYLTVTGYDSQGRPVASDTRAYRFRPAAMDGKFRDGIYLDLSKRVNQRLYVQKNGMITHVYLSSSSHMYDWRPPNSHTNIPHDHAGVFRVLDKTPNHYSALFHVNMPWAMRYLGGHYIHATSPNQYFALGGPASSGCNRLTWTDAYELYQMTPVGTRVEIIGPNG